MSETVTIPKRTYSNLDRILNKIDSNLNRLKLEETVSESEAAAFMEVGVLRFRNMVGDGTIPRDAYIILVNGTKKFFKDKLIKK